MKTQKYLIKYSILLLVYIAIFRILEPYGLKIYFTINPHPEMSVLTVQTFQSILTAIIFITNLLLMILVLIDSKNKKTIDWIIGIIIFFRPETGIILFLVWQIYKEIKEKYEA